MLDAIATTLVRMTVTRKRLLQWTTAAHTIRLFGQEKRLAIVWKQMGGVSVLALLLIMLLFMLRPAALPAAAPLLLAWLTALGIAAWIDRPLVHEQAPLPADDRQKLRSLARRTWYFFERFVGPEDHWLPPDHFQEDPRGLVAHRTSPTNIGLLLLSTLAAYDLGYIGLMDLVLRLNSTFDGMRELEQYRGHFLNWYETSSLQPLPPRYVSTVDSGNLAGCLVALKQGCLALPRDPVFRWQMWQGLLDALDVLLGIVDEVKRYPTSVSARPVGGGDGDAEPGHKRGDLETAAASLEAHIGSIQLQVSEEADNPARWVRLLVDLADSGWTELDRLLVSLVDAGSHFLDATTLRGLRISAERVFNHLQNTRSTLDLLLPWLLPLDRPPVLFDQAGIDPAIADAWQALQDALPITLQLDQVPAICAEGLARLNHIRELLDRDTSTAGQTDLGPGKAVQPARAWCESLAQDLASARMVAEGLSVGCHSLGERAEACFEAMDFGFLFDSQRQVFHLGYNVAAEKLDANHYDLLASEARIASLLAIAKGEVPSSHWLHLARPITRINRTRALLSWNGSMFEYLMPPLMMRHYEGTLLDHTDQAVVQRQIDYGRRKGVPWGISEAGYYGFDAHLNYQYRGFGVPGLGFKRGLGDDLVITPYASLLALSTQPRAVMRNVAHLTELGMVGAYGFYEAIDYTRSRLSLGEESRIVRSFMAHHQGMILLALANYLGDGAMVRRFHADPRVQSVELLLQEQVPEQVPLQVPHPGEVGAFAEVQPRLGLSPWRVSADAPLPQVHFLSNGRYGLLITGAGAGFSRWKDVDLTRWRADTTLDNWGTWLYVQDMENGRLWSAGLQPTGSVAEGQDIQFYAHMAEFHRWEDNISLRMEITIAPSDDVEVRLVTLTNHDDRSRRLMLTSYSEVVLAPQASDRRHTAFSKLFIESDYLPGTNSLLFRRRPRSVEEEVVFLAHMAIVEPDRRVTGAHESDRARFLGRGGTPRAPAALGVPASMGSSAKARPAVPGLSGTTGATLDPIMALAQEVTLEPHATAQVAFVTLAAGSRSAVLALAHRYQSFHLVKRPWPTAINPFTW
jgi:cyclic beta-1,2-glucan synthetase